MKFTPYTKIVKALKTKYDPFIKYLFHFKTRNTWNVSKVCLIFWFKRRLNITVFTNKFLFHRHFTTINNNEHLTSFVRPLGKEGKVVPVYTIKENMGGAEVVLAWY